MNKKKTEKLKRVHVLPLIIVLFVVMIIVAGAIALIAGGIGYNMTRGKISQGYKLAYRLYEQIKYIDDESDVNSVFAEYSKNVPEVTGVSIGTEDSILYTTGEQMSEQKTESIDLLKHLEVYNETENDYDVYLATKEGSLFEKFASGKIASLFLISIDEFGNYIDDIEKTNINDALNKSVFEQPCYYGFRNADGTIIYIIVKLYITMQDLFFLVMVFVSVVLICLIYFLAVVFILVRFIKNQTRVLKLYYTDKETGGKNWYYFLEKATKKMKKYRRRAQKSAIVHIRMEKYRSYCSCYGDAEGSRLVSDFYEAIKNSISKQENFARHEMCDFGLLLCYDNEEQLAKRVEQLISTLDVKRPNIKLYFKAGINLLDEEVIDPSEGYNRATIARRKIDDTHSDRVKFFTQEMKADLLWERQVENDMEKALANHEYKVYLQPKYSVDNEKLAAAEALVRWVHPKEGLVAPYKFIPIFEKNGFITKLDDYMIEEVAKLQANWIKQGKRIVPISVNVSRAHFTQDSLAEHICEIVDKYNVPHNSIELELTESAFFDDKQTLIDIVKKMKNYGFSVSMDDFGAGYSSLNSLKELPIDVVKLDAEFFRGNVIVGEAISLAKKLNMKIVAEGIETREQVDFLAENECDLIQGYYFAKPMPVEEFEAKVEQDGIDN